MQSQHQQIVKLEIRRNQLLVDPVNYVSYDSNKKNITKTKGHK